jgi:hypothetical protein
MSIKKGALARWAATKPQIIKLGPVNHLNKGNAGEFRRQRAGPLEESMLGGICIPMEENTPVQSRTCWIAGISRDEPPALAGSSGLQMGGLIQGVAISSGAGRGDVE